MSPSNISSNNVSRCKESKLEYDADNLSPVSTQGATDHLSTVVMCLSYSAGAVTFSAPSASFEVLMQYAYNIR